MAQKTVLITGGSGFIGSHLCDYFVAKDFKVIAMDNFITGRKKNVEHLIGHPNFKLIEQDVSEKFEFNESVDYVMHFACPASPVDFEKIPLEIMHVDSYGTFNCLEIALKNNARFILASTSEIYGDPLVHPQPETYWGNVNTLGARSCYDEAKRFSESATMVYKRKYNLNAGIVRIFNTYGPRMRLDDGRVVPSLIGQALKNESLTVFGNGLQTRSFCYVSDLVEGIFRLTMSDFGDPINMGTPYEYTINDFAKIVLDLTKAKSQIIYKPLLHSDDPKQRKPVLDRAKAILNWEAEVSIQEGLNKTIEYFALEINK